MKNNFERKLTCTFCNHSHLKLIINFGKVALAGAFLKLENTKKEKKYNLRFCFCPKCYAVQIADIIPPEVLFKKYFYFSSSINTLKKHFDGYARELINKFNLDSQSSVLEFGCNDGILLKPFARMGIGNIVGVDPAKNVISKIKHQKITTINDFFNVGLSKKIKKKFGNFDLIMANNVFAHIKNINNVTEAIKILLKKDGIFVFEVHYLGKVINELQYDMMYHEHLFYYSIIAATNHFKRHSMKIFDVKPIKIHSGSMRFYVCNIKGKYSKYKSKRLERYIYNERKNNFHNYKSYHNFSKKIIKQSNELKSLIQKINSKGETVVGYGASGRANTILQYCQLNSKHIPYIIDDAPAKIGFYTPGSHIKIVDSKILSSKERPDYILLFAWAFLDEIKERNKLYLKNGGKIIIPLPKVRIVKGEN